MATRLVWEIIPRADGTPWADFLVHIAVPATTTTPRGTFPGTVMAGGVDVTNMLPYTTDADGRWEAELEVGVPLVRIPTGAAVTRGTSTSYPQPRPVAFVVPDGDGPISLMTILASTHPDPADPTLPNIVAGLESALDDHVRDWDNPHDVTASQLADLDSAVSAVPDVAANTAARHTHANADVLDAITAPYTVADDDKLAGIADGATANATDAELRDRTTHTGVQAISTVTGLADALDAKQDADALGTAAYTDVTEYATATQGSTADNAVQPGTLASELTAHDAANRDRSNHTGTQAARTIADFDAAVEAVGDVAANTAARHTHANMETLDDVTDARLVPDAPVRVGQMVSWDGTGPAWRDLPGAVVPDLVASPHGAWTPEGAVTVTPSASVEVRGNAWWLCEGTKNLITNPSVEESLSGWSASGSSTVERVIAASEGIVAKHGSYVIKATRNDNNIVASRQVTLLVAGEHTFSGYVWIPPAMGGALGRNIATSYPGQSVVGQVPADDDARGAWQRIATTINDVTSGLTGWLQFNFITSPGYIVYIDATQAEAKPYATPFTVGTRAPGTIAIPHATRPAVLLIRYRESGLPVTTEAVTLDGNDTGTFGRFGVVSWDGSAITIATTSDTGAEANMYDLYGVAVWDDADALDGLTLDALMRFSGPYTMPMVPAYYVPDPLPATIAGYYPANRKIATGGTSARPLPGTDGTGITLAADMPVHDTGRRLNVSSVDYALIMTDLGQYWTAASKLIAL
ncbi:MAG TPA: hypothetical protein VNZ58_07440 [Thermomicrobiales bacterium]|nr:hypothetical protein [Thermomicrobiales bacterium]